MRKFISILSAAALVSSVVVVPITASAEGVLYSDSLNSYDTSSKSATGTVFAVVAGSDYTSVVAVEDWQWIFNSPSNQTLDSLTVGYDGTKGDDTGAIMIKEKEDPADKYLSMPQNRFATRCKPQISGFDNYTAEEGEDLVIAFDLKLASGLEDSAANPVLSVDGIGTVTTAEAGSDTWVPVRIVTSGGNTSIYVNGTQCGETTAGTVSVIRPQAFDSDTKIVDSSNNTSADYYATVDIDNIVILSAADGVNAEIPTAETHVPVIATEPPTSAEIDTTTTIDFDTTGFEAAGVTVTTNNGATVETTTDNAISDSAICKVTQTSSSVTSYAYAAADFTDLTYGKAHVRISYDLYVAAGGRLSVIFGHGDLPSGINANSLSSLFKQGLFSEESYNGTISNAWVHTVVDLDMEHGTGSYAITNAEGTSIGRGNIDMTDVSAITRMTLVSWSSNTSYLDNVVIETGGSFTPETPAPATPEPASETEGSNLTLLPEGATQFDTLANMEGTAEKVLNHSAAKPAVADGTASIYNADVTIRGKSVYAAYDVLINSGDSLSIQALGGDTSKIGTAFILTGNQDGTASASAVVDKGDTKNIAGNLVCGTWYRVLIELPQNSVTVTNDDGTTTNATNTGRARYTIYRIDAEDQSKVSEAAATGEDLTPRNLSDRAAVSLKAIVTGTPYIDNGVTFVAEQGLSLLSGEAPPAEIATPEPASTVEGSGIDLAASAIETIDRFTTAEGTAEKVLNHSSAKPVVAGEVNALSDSARGYSIFAAYDVYVKAGDKLTVTAMNNTDVGPKFVITGNADGTATASHIVSKDVETKLDGNLVCETWYRVVIEVPQDRLLNDAGDAYTSTGRSTYTIYRINASDTSQTAGIAAQATDIEPRNLDGKSLKAFSVAAEGTPYIDNGVTYRGKAEKNTWYRYLFTIGDNGVKTVTDIQTIDDPANTSGKLGTEYYIWNALMQPYIPAAE